MIEKNDFMDEIRRGFVGMAVIFFFLVFTTLFFSYKEEKIVYLNGEINSETRDVSRLFGTERISYFVAYYTLEDGGIKLFSMPKESTVIYYDLEEGEQCYAEYYVWILGVRTGEIKLHLHTSSNNS